MKNLKLFCGCYVFLLFYIKYTVSLKYVPPTRQIEVSQNHRYRIGVEDAIDEDITLCNFTSNTGLNCNFEVWPTRSTKPRASPYCAHNGQLFLFENIVTEHGKAGLCQITVENVQETGPSIWTLIAKNFDWDVVVNNTFEVIFYYGGSLAAYEVRVLEFSSFVNYMTIDADLKSCSVKFNGTEIELELHSPKSGSPLSPDLPRNEEVLERLSSLGRGLCGFKYTNATNTIRHLEWTISAADDQWKLYRGSFKTRINPSSIGNTHFKREVVMGRSFAVPCALSTGEYLCTIFNPAGELVQRNSCKYSIASITMNDIGVWKCFARNSGAMESTEYTIELFTKDNAGITTWFRENDDYYVDIGCQLIRPSGTTQYCKMVIPNQQTLFLQSTLATDRYLSLGTDLHEAVCSMQIKKPLQEFEKGVWQCEIGLSYKDERGGLINVGITEIPDYPKHLKLTTRLDDPFTVSCEVPYSSVFCGIYAPNGTEYFPKNEFEPSLGRCSLTVDRTTQSDNGTWICLFAQATGIPDDKIVVEVSIAQYLSHYKMVEVTAGDSAELLCSSGGLPLEYCRYIDPMGKSYHIHNRENSSSISYYGRGLEYGDCGIEISQTSMADYGNWTCVTKIIGDTKYGEVSGTILLVVSSSVKEDHKVKASEEKMVPSN